MNIEGIALTTEPPRTAPVLPPARPAPLRLRVLGRAILVMFTAPFALGLIAVWVTMVAVSPLTIVAPLVLPATIMVRAYADAHRRAAGRLTGAPVLPPYRPAGKGVIGRVLAVVRDPASWRDQCWLLVHAVVGFVVSTLSIALLLGGILYVLYPFLYWVTPQNVFGRPFGGWIELHSVAQACWFVPLGIAVLALWWAVAVPLARAEVALDRRLLAPGR